MIKSAASFFKESLGIYLVFQAFVVYLILQEGGWQGIIIPLLFLKAIEYTGLIMYYRKLRPDKLIFYMNLGCSIPRLWVLAFIFDLLVMLLVLMLLSL